MPTINTDDKNIIVFLSNLCDHKLKDETLNKVYNLIETNREAFEKEPVKLSILKYRLCNHISNYEKIDYKFFDMGFSEKILDTNIDNFKKNYIIDSKSDKDVFQNREIILIDADNDDVLKRLMDKIYILEITNRMYDKIIEVIISFMGLQCDDFKFNKFMAGHAFKNKSNIINIGDIDCGLDRHKSLLFKFICDKLNLPCSLLRNNRADVKGNIYDDHVWNLIQINGITYVVDFRYYANRIIYPNNTETYKYYNLKKFKI